MPVPAARLLESLTSRQARVGVKAEYPHVFRLGAPQPRHAAVWSADAMITGNIDILGAQ